MLYESIELSSASQVVDEVEEIITPTEQSIEKVAEVTEQPIKEKQGLFRHLWTWLRSPVNASWKDTQ